jgi:hypothetical protein
MAFGCFACLALSIPPLREQIKDVDMVVDGKLEITREKGLAVTWHPELKGQVKETKLFHLGRIRASRVLYKRSEIGDADHSVAFDSSWPLTNGTRGVWLLKWNDLLGRFS